MTATVATFRSTLPEFSNSATYPDATINLQLTMAYVLLNADVWDPNLIDTAACLFVAHMLVIGQRNQAAVNAGGVPGAMQGPQSAKAVDKVSVSYDTGAITMENAAFWNMSSYGVQLLTYARMMGAGGIQL